MDIQSGLREGIALRDQLDSERVEIGPVILALAWPNPEHCGDVHGKPRQQLGRRRFPAAVRPCFIVNLAGQSKDGDRLCLRVHDPVFRDAPLGIVAPLLDEVAFRFVFAHDFQGKVCTEPKPIFPADRRLEAARASRVRETYPAGFGAAMGQIGQCRRVLPRKRKMQKPGT